MEVDRVLNGTWGALRITALDDNSQKNLLVFDESIGVQESALAEYYKSLYYTDKGWLKRKVFVVNKGEFDPAKFKYTYETAVHMKALSIAMVTLLASLSIL